MTTLKKILIINFSPGITDKVTQLLNSEGIESFIYEENLQVNLAAGEDLLKIFCLPADRESGRINWPAVSAINGRFAGPALVVSNLSRIESFQSGIREGCLYFISTPSGRKHLLKQIKQLAEVPPDELQNELPGTPGETCYTSPLVFSLQNSIHYRSLKKKPESRVPLAENGGTDSVSPEMKTDLERGLREGEFRLYYQPIIDISTNRLSGFESLIRWEHPEKGMIMPDDFIPPAEQTNLIIPMGYWIIEEAVGQIHRWKQEFALDLPFRVGVNLSAKQFLHEGLSDRILHEVKRKNISPENIAFEITESAFMEDMEKANITLLTLKSNHFPLYLDDFGTGYSSLTYLLHFPVDTIKIDKSFVEWIHIDDQSREIVKSVSSLAHNLHMKVVAEGIESEEHLDLIQEYGIDLGQGYFFSKPLSASGATSFIAKYFQRDKP